MYVSTFASINVQFCKLRSKAVFLKNLFCILVFYVLVLGFLFVGLIMQLWETQEISKKVNVKRYA